MLKAFWYDAFHLGVHIPKSDMDYMQEQNVAIMKLVLSFGGPKLHCALSKALDLPSIRTTQTSSHPPIICPCISFPNANEITANPSGKTGFPN